MTRQRQSHDPATHARILAVRTELRRRILERLVGNALYTGSSDREIRRVARELSEYLMASPAAGPIARALLVDPGAVAPRGTDPLTPR